MTARAGRCPTCTGYYRLVDGRLVDHVPLPPVAPVVGDVPDERGQWVLCYGSGGEPWDEALHDPRQRITEPHTMMGGLPTLGRHHR